MTALTLPPSDRRAQLRLPVEFAARPPAAVRRSFLLFSEDEEFWHNLAAAAGEAGRGLVRRCASTSASRTQGHLKPAAVLLDLDCPAEAAWDAADSFLLNPDSLPLLLLTSRREQLDFKTAIQAGLLMDKAESPVKLLEIAGLLQESSAQAHRERNAMLKLVIRWLKPCNWSPQVIPLRRSWGINE